MSGALWIALGLLVTILWLEMVAPKKVLEGFQWITIQDRPPVSADTAVQAVPGNLLTDAFKRRSDIGPNREESGYSYDGRYFADYMDVQGIGVAKDYCRVVFPSSGLEPESFFACALAGTQGLTSIEYRTKAVKDGFRLGRDDYIRKIGPNGRDSYCRIVKEGALWQPMCVIPELTKFGDKEQLDSEPPASIKILMDFYRDCRMWLRFRDDMIDYMGGSTVLQVAGGASVSEHPPRPSVTRALNFNGKDQFLRLGDSRDLTLGNTGTLREVRAFSVWVRFDEFTNNAHIFDFGNGAGKDNVFLGILGRGDPDASQGNEIRPGSSCPETTVPPAGSGAQFCPEMRPQDLYLISSGNVNDFTCKEPEIYADPTKAQQLHTRTQRKDDPTARRSRATLLYEVWDSSLRVVQIKVNQAIAVKQWTHIVITATNTDAMRPDLNVYVNGENVFTLQSGRLPQAATTSKNYIGKSNWGDEPGGYELKDDLLSGSVFDFRMYNAPLSENKIRNIFQWGMDLLGQTSS
jgi:Concanavalin A-like lectin/glucanases superfamily